MRAPTATGLEVALVDTSGTFPVPGLDIVRVRPFNHIGPVQAPDYAVANWSRQIAAIEKGRQPPVLVQS